MGELRQHLTLILGHGGSMRLPAEAALQCEAQGYVEVNASKYKRKTLETLPVWMTRHGRLAISDVVRSCGGSQNCKECDGQGQHLHYSAAHSDCEMCEGSGDCPGCDDC